MKAIVAADRNRGIGKDGQLLAHLKGDMKFFKEQTVGKVVVMGRKTLESLPGGLALPERITIVVTKDKNYEAHAKDDSKVLIATSLEEVTLKLLGLEFQEGIDAEEDVVICGGQSIYEMFVPYCTEVLVTKIDKEYPADRHFMNMDKLAEAGMFKITYESDPITEGDTTYRFVTYSR